MGQPTLSPLVGREDELAALRHVLEGSGLGEPHLVVVQGEAGIGKSRLVREATTDVPAETVLLSAGCSGLAHRDIPWAPITQLVEALEHRVGREAFADLVGPYARALAPLVPALVAAEGTVAQSAGQVYAAVSHVVLAATDAAPVVAVVEDVHWADPASLAALEHLVASARDQPITVVLTVRDGDGDPSVHQRLEDLSSGRTCREPGTPPVSRWVTSWRRQPTRRSGAPTTRTRRWS